MNHLFDITNNHEQDFATDARTVALAGTALAQARFVAPGSTLTNVTWATVTKWSLSPPLDRGGPARFFRVQSRTNAP